MKKLISLVLTVVCVLGLVGCNTKSMNYIIANKPSVTGIVEEVHDDYIIVYSETAEGYPNGSNWSISLNVENKDSYTDVMVGDEIVFYYDGMAMETDPLQVSTVYAITLKTPADRNVEEKWAMIPMLMVEGVLYLDTGYDNTDIRKCGTFDGEITSTVHGTEKPTKDNESNFGDGYGYQCGVTEGTIEVYMNEKWRIFATEEVRQEIQFPTSEEIITFHDKTFNQSDLSQETIEWLEWYNSISEEEQLAINHIPSDLYELCSYPKAEAIEVSAEIKTDCVVTNIFTNESKTLSADDNLAIADILEAGTWNTEATADCLNNIEITINGETYMYHSDCGTFNDHVNTRCLTLDDTTTEKVNAIIEEYISHTATEVPAE